MKKINKNLLLLNDLVSESLLTEREGSLYGCRDGYAHNPFTGTCYPLPSKIGAIDGLVGPRIVRSKDEKPAVDEPGPDPTSRKQMKALVVNAAPFWKNPIQEAENCFERYPISSFVGAITGVGADYYGIVRGGFKAGGFAVKGSYKALKGAFVSSGRFIGSLTALAGTAYLYSKIDTPDIDTSKTYSWLDETYTKLENFLKSEWTDYTYEGAACAFNLMLSSYFLAKPTRFIGKKAIKSVVESADFRKEASELLGRSVTKKFKEGKPTNATLWIHLKTNGLLPDELGKISLDKEAVLRVPTTQDKVSIPISRMDQKDLEVFGDFIQGENIILDVNKASQEFADGSKEIIQSTNKVYWEQAKKETKNSRMLNDFEKLKKIVGRDGKIDKAKYAEEYLKETGELLENFIVESRADLDLLYENGNKLKGLQKELGDADLNKARELAIRGDDTSAIVSRTKGGLKNTDKLDEYVQLFKDYHKLESETFKKFSALKSFMEEEAQFSKIYGRDVNLKKMLTSQSGIVHKQKIEGSINKIKDFSKRVKESIVTGEASTSLSTAMELLGYGALAVGVIYVGGVVAPKWRKELSLPYIYDAAEKFFDKVVNKQYYNDFVGKRVGDPRNYNKLFDDFSNYYSNYVQKSPRGTSNYDPTRSVELVKEFCEKAKTNQDVKKHLEAGVQNEVQLKNNFLSLIVGQFEGTQGEKPEIDPEDEVITRSQNTDATPPKQSLMDQIPEGELVGIGAFPINIAGDEVKVKFTTEYFQLNGRRFKFTKTIVFDIDAEISSVQKQGNRLVTTLKASGRTQINKLSEEELKKIFSKANSLKNVGDSKEVRLGDDSGNIERIKENKEVNKMSKKDIRDLVAEVLNENYSKYPYNANEPSEGEPDEDYMVEWNALVDEVCGSKRKNVDGDPKTMEDAAVEVAKLFVKDQDLFRDVLEMAGSNKSIGVEILQQLKATREKSLDKEKNV